MARALSWTAWWTPTTFMAGGNVLPRIQGLAVLPLLLSIFGPTATRTVVIEPPLSPLDPWDDQWDKVDGSNFLFQGSPIGGGVVEKQGTFNDLTGGVPGGALGWHWGSGGDVAQWSSQGASQAGEGDSMRQVTGDSQSSGRGLSLPLVTHQGSSDDDVVP